jgi:hypothetical protein
MLGQIDVGLQTAKQVGASDFGSPADWHSLPIFRLPSWD